MTLSMLVIGGMGSLSGAVVGVVTLSLLIQVLRWFEQGVPVGGTTLSLPNGIQEIAIGAIMIVILVFRPSGITRGREIVWPAGHTRRDTGDALPTVPEGR
jgi:branched-chain amino acid transport system permease protein